MKILTNVQTAHLAGITQTFGSFLNYVAKNKSKKIRFVGVDISSNQIASENIFKDAEKIFKLVSIPCQYPTIKDVIEKAEDLKDLKYEYREVLEKYGRLIRKEKPDLVLLNGTYFLPWCLHIAAKEQKVPAILHYHGVLSKEVAHWDEKPRQLFQTMEKSFDDKGLFYIFPSQLARDVVEREVFEHRIRHAAVLPNPIPEYFFHIKKKKNNEEKVGIVSRWSRVKNPSFFKKFAKYNQKHGGNYSVNIVTDLKKDSKTYQELADCVNFYAPMSNQKLSKFYSKMGVILSPSFFETYGNVPQEALASGTPALVNANMGVAETFRNLGLEDWVVDFKSTREVYRKIKDVIKKPVSQDVREKMRDYYSTDIVNYRLLNILKSI